MTRERFGLYDLRWLLWVMLASCVLHRSPDREPQHPDTSIPLTYRLYLSPEGVRSWVDVTLLVQRAEGESLAEPFVLRVPHRWAGFRDLHLDVVRVRAFSENGDPLVVHRDTERVSVDHSGLNAIRVEYRVEPRARALVRSSRFHAVGAAGLFFAYGRNLFLWPISGFQPEAPIRVEFRAPSDSILWASTLGVFQGGSGTLVRPFEDFLDAAYLAGHPRSIQTAGGEPSVILVVDPDLGWIGDPILELARRLIAQTTNTLGEPPTVATVGLLLHRQDGADIMTGSGRPGGFVLELGSSIQADGGEMAQLIAHENLHRYIGTRLRFAPQEDGETLWFKEGVVEYLATQIVVRSGLASPDLVLEALSEAVTGCLAMDSVPVLRDDPHLSPWQRGSILGPLSYHRGFLLAFWLDIQLRRAGDRLESIVVQLLRQFAPLGPITNGDIRAVLEQRLGTDSKDWFERYVVGREPLPLGAWLSEAGLSMCQVRHEAMYYGIEVAPNSQGIWHVIRIDPLGPASRSPIRVGDRLARPPDVPSRGLTDRARFRLLRGGEVAEVWIPPQPGLRLTWSVQPEGTAFDQLMGW